MKRAPLKRRKALGRGAVSLARSGPLRRSGRLKRAPRPQLDWDLAGEFFQAVLTVPTPGGRRKRARCAVCGAKAHDAHHVLPAQTIKAYAREHRLSECELDRLLWDPANGLGLCRACHDEHERAVRRVPRGLVPPQAWAFSGRLGLMWKLEHLYPDG